VLEGPTALGPDDVNDALAKAQQRAEDLEATITSLLDTARYAADWRTRECVLGWTEDAYRDAKAITKELRSHITLVEVSEGSESERVRGWCFGKECWCLGCCNLVPAVCKGGLLLLLLLRLRLLLLLLLLLCVLVVLLLSPCYHTAAAAVAAAAAVVVYQSVGRSSAYNDIILRCTPAVVSLVVALVSNVTDAIAPHLHQQQQQQQQQQRVQDQQQQQLESSLHEQLWRCQQDIQRSSNAAAAAAGSSSSGSSGSSVPFTGGEDEVRAAFKLVRRLVDLLRDMRDRCR